VAVCAARALASRLGDDARVEAIPPPDTDVIRLVETEPSVTMERRRPDGTLLIRLDRFGRRSIAELLAAVGEEPVGPLLLDLTRNRGGRLGRALEVAALFSGPVPDAVLLEARDGASSIGIAAPRRRLAPDGLTVRIGPGTASSAEVLALLLRRHADARIVGARSAGKDVAQHALPVDAGTRLIVPIGRIVVVGERLAGGIGPTPGGRPEPAR
jgi:carboxyl-terminal processing protease